MKTTPIQELANNHTQNFGTYGLETGRVTRHFSGDYTIAEIESLLADMKTVQRLHDLDQAREIMGTIEANGLSFAWMRAADGEIWGALRRAGVTLASGYWRTNDQQMACRAAIALHGSK